MPQPLAAPACGQVGAEVQGQALFSVGVEPDDELLDASDEPLLVSFEDELSEDELSDEVSDDALVEAPFELP